MKRASMAVALLVAGFARAGTFVDDFSAGARAAYWEPVVTNFGIYSWNDTGGDVHMFKIGNNPGGLNHLAFYLNFDALGGPVAGDFDTKIDFRNVVFDGSGTGYQQVEFQAGFVDNSIFFDVFSPENGGPYAAHVWDGGFRGLIRTGATQGTFRIARQGATLSGYFNDQLIYSKSATTSNLKTIRFVLQNNAGNNSPIQATFDNFQITGASVTDRVTYLRGQIELLDYLAEILYRTVDVTLEPVGGGTPILLEGIPLDNAGRFEAHTTHSGEFDVFVQSRSFLRKKVRSGAQLLGGGSAVSDLDASLINGDCDGDNSITVFDYALLSDMFDWTVEQPGFDDRADLDGDGAVTVFDYAIISNNFDQVGD